jgi:lipocalin
MKRKQYRMLLLALALILGVFAYESIGQSIDSTPIEKFNLKSFLGRWYEIARLDHRFERGMTAVTADYMLKKDGTIEVINSGIKNGKRTEARGKAKLTDTPGRLRVSFFWFFYSDYNVLAMDEKGQWALIGSKSPKYLWILSRMPSLEEETLRHIIALAKAKGYDTDKLIIDNP